VAAGAEVDIQDVVMETRGMVEGVMIKIISLEHQKMEMSMKAEGLVTIKDGIEVVEMFEKITLVVVMSMW
jgi:hypothetical protein